MKKFILSLVLFFVVTGCQATPDNTTPDSSEPQNQVAPMSFGDYPEAEGKSGLENVRTQFKQDEVITFHFQTEEILNTHEVTIKLIDDKGRPVEEWEDRMVDALWEGLKYKFYDPAKEGKLEPGKYQVQVFRETDNKLLSEGEFTIIE